ncbi:MAG: hypothetical protein ACKV2Q_10030 [Planctomycetaceae bacterium]
MANNLPAPAAPNPGSSALAATIRKFRIVQTEGSRLVDHFRRDGGSDGEADSMEYNAADDSSGA